MYGLNVPADEYADSGVRLLRTTDIDADGRLSDSAVYLAEDRVPRDALLRDGDLLLSRSGTLGRAFVARRPAEPMTYAGYLVRFRPSRWTDPRYLWYCTQSHLMQDAIAADAIQSTIANFNADKYANVSLPDWSFDEQRAVADYLDRETARIDALIAAKRDQSDRLGERVGSAVQAAIDRSLASRLPLRRLIAAFVDYRGATPEKSTSGVPLITATNVANGRIDLARGEQFVSEDTYATWMRRGFPEVGDVLLTTEAPLGEVAAIEDPRVALAQRIILLKPNRDRVLAGFLRIALLSAAVQADLRSRASGSTVWGIRADRLRDVQVPVPEIRDQHSIIRIAREAEQASVAGAELITRQMRLLTERRQALITAAVIGNLPIPVSA